MAIVKCQWISLAFVLIAFAATFNNVNAGSGLSTSRNVKRLTTNSDEEGDAKIFFPGYTEKVDLSSRSKRACVDKFCDELDHYPAEYITNMIGKTSKFKEFFNVDVSPPVEITDRIKFDYTREDTLCEFTTEARYPKTGVNTNNTERIIVNTDGFKQLVMTEVCNKNARCKFSESFPNEYESSCKQKYIRRRLVSMDDKSKEPFVDVYDIPCCCVCSIKKKLT